MGKLFRTPEGFLDLTGQRVGGQYPQELSDVVVPVADLTPLLTGRLIASETGASVTSNVGDTIDIEVPPNENWLLFGVSWSFVSAAANDQIRCRVSLTQLPGSSDPINIVPLMQGETFVNGLNVVATRGPSPKYFGTPIALSPGCIVRLEVQESNNVGLAVALQVGIVKLTGN